MLQYPYNKYVIVVPEDFTNKKDLYDWPRAEHVSFDFIAADIVIEVNKGNLLQASYKRSKLLKEYVEKYSAVNVFLIVLMAFVPCLPFVIPKSVSVSGIIYKLYLYNWKELSPIAKLMELLKYKIITINNCIQTVFTLNDSSAAATLNRLYKTKKFRFLTDPYNETNYHPKNILDDFGVGLDQTVFLHFGGLVRRKGTLKILEAIKLIPKDRRKEFVFIFAGLVYDDIKSEFYNLLEEVRDKVHIIVFDEFCTNELLCDLCYSCDVVLMPYSRTSQSSGALGYAAWNEKPVIGPASGLLGKLIRKNRLGEGLAEMSSQQIAASIINFKKKKIQSKYKENIRLDNFVVQVFNAFISKP